AAPFSRGTNHVWKRSLGTEEAGKGPSVIEKHQETELLLRQLGWMAASLNLLPGSGRNTAQFCEPLHQNKTCSLDTGSGFTFVSEQIEPGFHRGSRDRGQRGPDEYVLCVLH
ncbi:hypothetical protein HispidOSU_010143, partial [Sigmodon hispidus]